MRIGIDISTVLNHGKDVGAGRYIINLVKNLFEIDSGDEFILTGRYIADDYLWLAEELRQHYFGIKEITSKPILSGSNPSADNYSEDKSLRGTQTAGKLSFKLIKTTQNKLDLVNRIGFPPMEFYGFKADVFHCPDFLIPPTLNKKIILTIHDLAFIRFPQFNFDWFVKKYTKLVRRNANAASAIIADSQSTKNDIVEFFGIKEDKVTVVYLAGDKIFRKLNAGEIDHNVAEKYKITKKFILSAGTIEPRKNYATLIKAFNRLKSENQAKNGNSTSGSGSLNSTDDSGNLSSTSNTGDLQLVIVGRTGWMSEATIAEYNSSPFRNDIILAGRLSDMELLQMYNMAELFVYPSVFEGFGLPVLEAMQCGLPVIASNSSSIPELIDDKRLLFDPADEGDILDKIYFVLNNDTFRVKLSEEALKNSAKFSWKNTAQKTLEVYRNSASTINIDLNLRAQDALRLIGKYSSGKKDISINHDQYLENKL
jgi:glycosyltransferase involved in cell wall biosynthesis